MTGDIFTGRVESIASNGCWILSHEGRRVFADFTAPGDVVAVRVGRESKGFVQAEVLEIAAPSPERVEPLCALFGRCGGWSLQQLSYEAQIAEKARILADAFTRIGGFDALPQTPTVRSEPFGYRNRMQFHCVAGAFHGKKQAQGGGIHGGRLGRGTEERSSTPRRQALGASLVGSSRSVVGFMARQSGRLSLSHSAPLRTKASTAPLPKTG